MSIWYSMIKCLEMFDASMPLDVEHVKIQIDPYGSMVDSCFITSVSKQIVIY